MFHNSTGDLKGYWGPPTSTIDWCEPNYVVSYYVAEWWNTFSSLLMSLGGAVGMYWAYRCGHERRAMVFAFFISFVGFGSAAFHGSLLFHTQLLDELPMIYAMLCWWYIWFGCLKDLKKLSDTSSSTTQTTSSSSSEPSVWMSKIPWLAPLAPVLTWPSRAARRGGLLALVARPLAYFTENRRRAMISYGLFWTISHTLIGFTVVFQVHFFFLLVVGLLCVHEFKKHYRYDECTRLIDRWRNYYVLFSVAAFAFWITDNVFCEFLRSLPVYPQHHAIWHFLCGCSTYSGLVLTVLARRITLTSEVMRDSNSTVTRTVEGILQLRTRKLPRVETVTVPNPLAGEGSRMGIVYRYVEGPIPYFDKASNAV